MRPGVIPQLDLTRFHQRRKRTPMVGPTLVHTGDKEREARTGVLRELDVRADNVRPHPVVDGQREIVATPG